MTTNPPVSEPDPVGDSEQRWQQPSFTPGPESLQNPVTGSVLPAAGRPVSPPSPFESVVGALAGIVWPVAILLIIFTKLAFWPVLIAAIVAGTVLGALKRNQRQRRLAGGGDPRFG